MIILNQTQLVKALKIAEVALEIDQDMDEQGHAIYRNIAEAFNITYSDLDQLLIDIRETLNQLGE